MEPGNLNKNTTSTATSEIESVCSTPYASAPSSPGLNTFSGGYFFSAPASPVHYILSSFPSSSTTTTTTKNELLDHNDEVVSTSKSTDEFEFEFSARSMISADELFLNGQIRPMKLFSHLEEEEEEEDEDEEEDGPTPRPVVAARGRDLRWRNRSVHRRTRSMSPVRNPSPFQWQYDDDEEEDVEKKGGGRKKEAAPPTSEKETGTDVSTPSVSASSSRSSSSSNSSSRKNPRTWVFLKDLLLHRSKSEGSGSSGSTGREKFWHTISLSPSKVDKHIPNLKLPLFSKDRSKPPQPSQETTDRPEKRSVKPKNGVVRRRRQQQQHQHQKKAPSAHERHYTANRAQAEEMRRKTFLPYRQGLLGCLGFTSRSYGAMNGFARTLNSVAAASRQ